MIQRAGVQSGKLGTFARKTLACSTKDRDDEGRIGKGGRQLFQSPSPMYQLHIMPK